MKKYLSILAIILLCAFLFVSCEDFDLDALGGIIGDLTGGLLSGGDEETFDYSNPGGATASELEGTWTASSTSFNENFDLVDSVVTVTIGGSHISIIEKDLNDNVLTSREGALSIEDGLLVIEQTPKQPDEISYSYISIKEEESKKSMIDIMSEDIIDDPESKYSELKEEATALVDAYDYNLFGSLSQSRTTYGKEILDGNDFVKSVSTTDFTEDGSVIIEVRAYTFNAHVDDVIVKETPVENEVIRVKYHEEERTSENLSIWYRYTKETDTLEAYIGGEALKLTRSL